ncbi:protein-export chaperone SecB [Curvivirga sp.]|uniref:protein-export chaperone SecB n=1 Tax=Curvivirga sp. TaxID=2856848 RepID=UPI003B59BF5C
MSDTAENQAEGAAEAQAPAFQIIHQYLKDLSVEVPNAPHIFQKAPTNPQLSVNVDVTLDQLAEKDFEVSLHLHAKSEQDGEVQHQTELVYSSIVAVSDLKQDMLQAILFIEIPRMLFPFARQILTSSVINTGFPPINLAPVDFVDMFRQRIAAAKAEMANREEGEAVN